MPATEITNSTLVIKDSQLVIALVFNMSLFGDLNLNGISLSNSVNFDSLCTFNNLSILVNFSSVPILEHNLTISFANSTNITRVIGDNPETPCLSDINSTFLRVQSDFLPVFSSQTVYALNVVPDTNPPSFSPSGVIVDLRKGFISIMFSEIIDPSTLDTSLLSLVPPPFQGQANSLILYTLVNSNNDTSVNSTYTIRLEVFELPHVSSICGSFSCNLRVGTGDIVTDVFGNQLQTQSFDIQANYINYDPTFFEGTVTIIPHTATQVNFSTTPPAERVEDVIGYQIYMFPLFVSFYDASCDYYLAYEFQQRKNITQWFFENPLNNNFPPCLNTSDYRCIFTNGENVTIDIFPGYAFANIIITIYPQIMFNDSSSFKFADEYYFEALQFQIFVDDFYGPPGGNGSTGNETNGPTPIGNRLLIRWNVDPSFCDEHQLTIKYGQPNIEVDSVIALDRLETCVDQYTYIYANSISTVVVPEIRINSSQIHVPEGSCINVKLIPLNNFSVQIDSFVTERPVVSSIEEFFGSTNISLNWITFLPELGFVIDFYNIYSFPVFALKYNGGSCNNVNSETAKTEFSFKPTEYYIHGVSLSTDFPFTCPPTPGDGLIYGCSSVIRDSNQLFHSFPYDNTYAQGIVVEAVVRQKETNIIEKIRSFPINYKTFYFFEQSGNGLPSFEWNPQLCQSDTSFIYFHYFIPSESEPTPETNSVISPCSDDVLVLDNVQENFFFYSAHYISEVTAASSVECLLSYESQVSTFSEGEPSNFPEVVHFEYLDYETILISIFNGEDFSIPANIYTIPFKAQRLRIIGNENDFCPSNSSELPPFFVETVVNTSFSDINNLSCINTNNYLCTTVSNTENIVLRIFPGFDSIIRVELADIDISQFDLVPGEEQLVYSLTDSEFAFVTGEQNTNVTLLSPNSIRFDWNVEFYCPRGSFIHLTFSGFSSFPGSPGIPEVRRRREFPNFPNLSPGVTIPCNIGTHTFNDLSFNTNHQFTGQVFFNSTAEFFQTCPVIRFLAAETIQTLQLVTEITLLDVSRLQLVWNLIPQVTSYTVLAYPVGTETIAAPLGGEFFESNSTSFFSINFSINPMELFELCLNSSQNLTCSKLTTSDLSAIVSIIPGYEYNLALSYELMGETIITIIDQGYNPSAFLSSLVESSGFDSILSFRFNDSICSSSSVSTVFYHNLYNNVETGFPVNPCMGNEQKINITDFPIGMIRPRALFIFPFTNITAPGFNIATPQANIVVFAFPEFSFLPIGASPMVTTVTPPLNLTSDLYQVSWSFPPLDVAQEFDTFVLYAFPNSNIFITSNSSCPDIFPGEVEVGFSSLPIDTNTPLQCPPPVDQFYQCGEYPSMSGDIQLFTLLYYDFLVEARFRGGLRVYHSDYLFYTMDKQEISTTLGLAFQVTPQSIVVTWNSQVSYCSNSKLFFSVNSSVDSGAVPCSSANYTIVSLTALTTYQIEYKILYDLTGIQAGTEKCITNVLQLAFDSLPVTTSFCTPVNPCGSVGVCSEGFLNSSFHCDCNTGYMFDANTCVDINECFAVPSVCVNAACLNSVGNFSCTCFEGYTPMGASTTVCEDIDECEIAGICVNGNCTNLLSPENYRCDCNSDFEGTSCTIPNASPTCPSITETTLLSDNNITFPVTEYGVVATVSCSQLDTELFGSITRLCGDTGDWGTVNIDDCQRIIFVAIEQTTTLSQTRTLTPVETVTLSDDLATATEVSLFPGEISVASVGVVAIAEALSNLTGDELRESLSSVQGNIVETGSNILRRENSAAFASATPSEAQSYVNNLVDGIQDIGILIGSVAEDNATIVLEISEPTVALIVTVVRNVTEPLVLGSNLSMSVGSNASAVMAAQTSVSIPASVFQANDDGNGIAVSVALFSTVQELISEVVVNTSEQEADRVRDSLASSLASVNLFTRSGQQISQLAEPISIRFVVNSSLIVENSQETTEIRCASSRMLSDGWSFLYVDLANPGDVPPDPANCLASHLTHFGVLVSVTSLELSEAERLGLEITTYITCSASILALLFSIVAYVIVWWKTRNNQQSPFNKDATILHLNFAVSLLLALVFFLISDAAYGNEGLCKAVILFQYYFWLSVFTASLSIGIYLMIKIFAWSSQRRFWHYLVLLSWGLPIPLLIITPSITFNYIINTKEMVCWFSKEPRYANLGFIVPMLAITLTNFVILIITAIVLFRISKGKKGMVSQIRGVLIASFILAPILGLPWLFSIITTAPTSAVAFIFTIILGLQGVLFAILYPLRTSEVIDYVLRCKTPKSKTMSKMVSSSVGTASRTPPSALKFRIKRAGQNTRVDKSTSTVITNRDTVEASGDFESKDIHIEEQKTSSVIIENVHCVPSPEHHASLPEDTEANSTKSKSPPPYESLGEEIETYL